MTTLKFIGLYVCLAVSFCIRAQTSPNNHIRLLFIGNSLTYQNNIPQLVLKQAHKNAVNMTVEMVALPNYALIDHWNDQSIQKAIAYGKYDFVIVQQGPSSRAFGRQVLIDYGQRINDLCKKHGAKMMYYMVWPARPYYHTFNNVIKNHYDAAAANNALICPVGEKWKQALEQNPKAGLYGADAFHPSLKGSMFAAEKLYKCVLENK